MLYSALFICLFACKYFLLLFSVETTPELWRNLLSGYVLLTPVGRPGFKLLRRKFTGLVQRKLVAHECRRSLEALFPSSHEVYTVTFK